MNKGVDLSIILKRILLVTAVFLTAVISLFFITTCSIIKNGSENYLSRVGINYFNENMEYCFRLETSDYASLTLKDNKPIYLTVEAKETVLFCEDEGSEKYTFLSLSDDRLFYQEKNIMFFNENIFVEVES